MEDEEKQAKGGVAAPGVPPSPPPAEPVSEPAAPSPEAEFVDLKARYEALEVQLKEEQARRQGLDRKLSQVQKETPAAGISNAQYQALRREMAKMRDEYHRQTNPDDTAPSYEVQLEKELKAEEEAGKVQWESRVYATWDIIVDDLAERGITPQQLAADPEFKTLWQSGDLVAARRRAARFSLSSPAPKTGESEENEEDKVNRRAKEIAQAELRKRGVKATDEGTSGRSPNWNEVSRRYAENPNDPATRQLYLKMRGERGL